MRVVLDTNVVVSAILFARGSLTWIRPLWEAGRFAPLIDRPCVEELYRVLTYPKFALEQDEIDGLLESYLSQAEAVGTGGRLPTALPPCRDPHDRKFLRLAAAGRADVLVSGDRALLELAGETRFVIETPVRFRLRHP